MSDYHIPAAEHSAPKQPLTGRREYGQIPFFDYPINFNGRWVVRDANGFYIDHDQYRNDLTSRLGEIDFNDGLAVPSNSFKDWDFGPRGTKGTE